MPTTASKLGTPPAMDIESILRETRTVAIVGASANRWRASHSVWDYLSSASDYELYLVNPTISHVGQTPVYPNLAALPVAPDLVDVFRRHDQLPSVLKDTIAVGAQTLWLQSGLWHDDVARDGRAAGLQVVMDRCLKVEHARWISAS
jgi:predicted CoA-binding protein